MKKIIIIIGLLSITLNIIATSFDESNKLKNSDKEKNLPDGVHYTSINCETLYDPNMIKGVVSGDFDRDGLEDEVAAFYKYPGTETRIHVWQPWGVGSKYHGDDGWWSSTQYDAECITGVVSGDFDRDGYKDNIAVFYKYPGTETRIHVWKSTGTSFVFQGSSMGWWKSTVYNGENIIGRVVSGDFDRDGYEDDITAFYQYAGALTKAHVWSSTGSSFTCKGTWWTSSSYYASSIKGTVVVGDFDRDGYKDDITAFYNYSGPTTKAHVWSSTGSGFSFKGTWWQSGAYESEQIEGKVVAGDFDHDGYHDDIAAFYRYSSTLTKTHVWKSTGSSFAFQGSSGWWSDTQYDANKINYRVVSGEFNQIDQTTDAIMGIFDLGNNETVLQLWISRTDHFWRFDFWETCIDEKSRSITENINTNGEKNINNEFPNSSFKVFPNPTNGSFTIKMNNLEDLKSISVSNITGQVIKSTETMDSEYSIDISEQPTGIYYVKVVQGDNVIIEKVVKQ